MFAAGITELGCMAHARRKFHDLPPEPDCCIGTRVVRGVVLLGTGRSTRRHIRQECAQPTARTSHRWLIAQRQRVQMVRPRHASSSIASNAGRARTRYLNDEDAPINNNWVGNQTRTRAFGRSSWLFALSLRGGQCGRHNEPDQVGAPERARSVCLSEGRAHATADAEKTIRSLCCCRIDGGNRRRYRHGSIRRTLMYIRLEDPLVAKRETHGSSQRSKKCVVEDRQR